MIYGRGKWLYGALVMVARDAARHFVRVKNPRGSSGSWRPLVLRWRRRHKRREHVSTSNAAIGARVFWFPQFHFHYATQRNDRTRRDGVVTLAHGPQVSETRVVVDRHWTSVRSSVVIAPASRADRTLRQFHSPHISATRRDTALVGRPRSLPTSEHSIQLPQTNRVSLTWRPFYSRQSLRHWNDAGLTNTPRSLRTSGHSIQALQTNRVSRRPFHLRQSLRHWNNAGVANTPRSLRTNGHSIIGQTGSRPRPLQFGKIPENARAGKPREEQILVINNAQIWHHGFQIFGRHPAAPGDPVSRGRKEHKVQPVQFDGPEELVWRRARRPSMEVGDPESRQELSRSYEQPALRSFQSHDAAQMPASFAQPAVQQITKLDPGVLDRLTEDVIRRVEQRVRIERERRGL